MEPEGFQTGRALPVLCLATERVVYKAASGQLLCEIGYCPERWCVMMMMTVIGCVVLRSTVHMSLQVESLVNGTSFLSGSLISTELQCSSEEDGPGVEEA